MIILCGIRTIAKVLYKTVDDFLIALLKYSMHQDKWKAWQIPQKYFFCSVSIAVILAMSLRLNVKISAIIKSWDTKLHGRPQTGGGTCPLHTLHAYIRACLVNLEMRIWKNYTSTLFILVFHLNCEILFCTCPSLIWKKKTFKWVNT